MFYTSWLRVTLVALMLAFGMAPIGARMALAQIELDLRDADVRSFVEIVSEATGRSYVLDPGVRGTVTVLAPKDISPSELYEVFLSVLELNRLTIVEGIGSDRIVPMTAARELATGTKIGVADGAYETRVIQVNNAPLNEIIEVVRPLLPSEAVISAVPGSNLLILSDRGQNHRRIEALIKRLDKPRDKPIEMIRLRNADANDVLQVVQSMNIIPEGGSVTVDRRSNALVISGPDRLRARVRTLASRLDTQQNNMASTVITLNYAEAPAMADVVLRSLSGTGDGESRDTIQIVPEPQTNALLITAPQDRMHDIHAMVRHLDKRPRQVLVEAVIFEMSVEGFSDLSVQFGAILNSAIVGGAQFSLEGRPSLTNLVSGVLNGNAVDAGSGGVIAAVPKNSDRGFAAFLTAIASTNSTRLLSTPSIMTLNNQEAEIVVAQNVPFVTGAFTSTEGAQPENPFQTIERQDVGLTLNVTPRINADKTVKMAIKQEVSSLTRNAASSGGEITSRRALSTTVLVGDGNVIMLGGLLENGSGSASQRVPGLSNLPLVGGLFRGKNAGKNQRVLLVMLRPQVVSTEHEAKKLTRELAREAKAVALAIEPLDDGRYPKTPPGAFPFDGADLNQPFDAGFVDDIAQRRNFPPPPQPA